jgi:hypothetical protein
LHGSARDASPTVVRAVSLLACLPSFGFLVDVTLARFRKLGSVQHPWSLHIPSMFFATGVGDVK